MTYAAKAILWIVAGPVASAVIGYAVFIIFAFGLGAGFDMDDIGTPVEKFFGRAAIPSLVILTLGGSILSLTLAIRHILAHRKLVGSSCSWDSENDEQLKTN